MLVRAAVIGRSVWHNVTLERLLFGLLACAIVFAIAALCLGLFQPLTDQHAFRQTQTALTTYWLMRGGPIFAYETPVLGFPWSIPFEFPTHQIVTAALASVGVPLDAAGRIVSFAFFLGCLWPIGVLLRALRFDRIVFLCVAIPFILCPLYIYWSRAFMIETCALFFCLVWLAYLARYLADPKPAFAAIAIVAGSLGVVTKVTTFPAFVFLGGLLFLKEGYCAWRAGLAARRGRMLAVALLVIAIPFIIGGAWSVYSEGVRAKNEIAASFRLGLFVFGTLDQRVGSKLWHDVIGSRVLTDVFGYAALPAVALIAASFMRRQYACAALAAVMAFLIPFLVFANLHIVHNYYQTANAIFIVAAVGFGIAAIINAKRRLIGLVCLVAVAASQFLYFRSAYAFLSVDFPRISQYRIAQTAKSITPPDSGLIVIGDDWSSLVPYYAQRKSLVVPYYMSDAFLGRVFAAPQRFLGGLRLGGVVYCLGGRAPNAGRQALVDAFLAERPILAQAGDCTLLAAEKR